MGVIDDIRNQKHHRSSEGGKLAVAMGPDAFASNEVIAA
jgi:hypothetical protein